MTVANALPMRPARTMQQAKAQAILWPTESGLNLFHRALYTFFGGFGVVLTLPWWWHHFVEIELRIHHTNGSWRTAR